MERGTCELARYLVGQGHQAWVVSGGGGLVADLEASGAHHQTLDIGRKSLLTLRHVGRLRKIIRESACDVIHVRSRLPAWINQLALRGLAPNEKPVVISTVHGAYSVNAYSAVMLKADRVIAISDFILDYIHAHYPRTPDSIIEVIHRGIDSKSYHFDYQPQAAWLDSWYREYPATRNKPLLCLPGRLTRLKGQLDFIRLCQALQSQGLDFHAIIVGGHTPNKASYFEELQAAANQAGLLEKLSFVGSRRDLIDILSICDIVYSLSQQAEAFGRTSLEALSLNTPVIAYDHGGSREILSRLLPEGLVPLGNIEACVEKTFRFLKQAQRLSRMNTIPWTIC